MSLQGNFRAILRKHRRVAIVGGPRMGKTTLAGAVTDRPVIGSDAYQKLPWEAVPLKMIEDLRDLDRFLVEGVQTARALRKGLEVDAVIYLSRPNVKERKTGQVAMAKGIQTIFREWRQANQDVPVFSEELRQ